MEVNNSLLRWSMHEGIKDGVELGSFLKVRYDGAAELDPSGVSIGRKLGH